MFSPSIQAAVQAACNGVPSSVPRNLTLPSIDNTNPVVGQTLTASPGTWTGPATSYSYQWSDWARGDIIGATGSTYQVTIDEGGSMLYVKVTAHNSAGDSAPASSSPTAAVIYLNTAFVSVSGDDSNAFLNDPGHPYRTISGSVAALAASHPEGEVPTTLRLLSDIVADAPVPANLDRVLQAGLTIQSADGTVKNLTGGFNFGTQAGASLTLSAVTIDTLTKQPHEGPTDESAGTIMGDGASVVGRLVLDADPTPAVAGMAGEAGPDVNGTPGQAGSSGAPPTNGSDGGSANAVVAVPAGPGGTGNCAWDVTLLGSFTISQISGVGAIGGNGGNGAFSGNAYGGFGGSGGDASDDGQGTSYPGGNGGNGGDASATGGDGGAGGTGGDGSVVSAQGGVQVGALNLAAGAGGSGGSGSNPGLATAGGGGFPGEGVNGGGSGFEGNPGNASTGGGATGPSGANGTDGSIQRI